MSCCGKKREQIRTGIQSRRVEQTVRRSQFNSVLPVRPAVVFEYVGKTALTAIGPVSGRHYRFSGPGAIVEVDPRDSPSLAAVPNIRKRLSS
jgi:hypothetical protein